MRPVKLNKTDMALLRYLASYHKEHGFAPVIREMAKNEVTSTSVIEHRLGKLEAEKLITRKFNKARSVRITPAGQARLVKRKAAPVTRIVLPFTGESHPVDVLFDALKRAELPTTQLSRLTVEWHDDPRDPRVEVEFYTSDRQVAS